MALVAKAVCPTCGQPHSVSASPAEYGDGRRELVRVCAECALREARQEADSAKETVMCAAMDLVAGNAQFATTVVTSVVLKVLVERACAAESPVEHQRRLREFWVDVARGIEE